MILGLDIGGANLKAATDDGRAASAAFALWKSPDQLPDALRSTIEPLGICERIAVTMTGELADCFATKAEGVVRIVAAVEQIATGRPVRVWTTDGEFISSTYAATKWQSVAAANWHALASWAGGQFVPRGAGLLIDIGSTTTDVIPLDDGRPCPQGRTDVERLMHGELIYTGVRRTPVCAVTHSVMLRDRPCPLAAEFFATMLDVYLILGQTPPDEHDCDTADGRPATVACAENRLAHMLCCDRTELAFDEIRSIAGKIARVQQRRIRDAVAKVGEHPATVIFSGTGEFLANASLDDIQSMKDVRRISLSKQLSPDLAEAACAYAVAQLARTESAI